LSYGVNGCTDNDYYALLIDSYVDIGTNVEYKKMPLFNSYDKFVQLMNSYKFNWVCTCKGNGSDCDKAVYLQYNNKGCDRRNLKSYLSQNTCTNI
jgi:hypothetical protein